MGLLDFLRGKRRDGLEVDPLHDLTLAKLRVGYLVDYDMETWRVSAYHTYDWGDGERVEEWELSAGHRKRYLERFEDDGEHWSLSKKIPIAAIDGEVRSHIAAHDDPPQRVAYQGVDYFLDSSSAGHMSPGGGAARQALIKWEFVDQEEARFLTVEQWGETEFEAAAGFPVEEYQFENILPEG